MEVHNMSNLPIGVKRAAVLCLLVNNDKVLLVKRGKDPHQGKYIPVGGKIEPFETPLQAAKREVSEETNNEVVDFKFCGVMVETSPQKFNWINFIYVSNVEYFEPKPFDEGELVWHNIDDILDLPTPKTDWYIYKYIRENKPFMFDAIYDENITLLSLIEEIENIKLL